MKLPTRKQKAMLVTLFLTGAAAAQSDSDYTYGRVRYLEAGVTLQRATETGAEEAAPNLPFLPGDRVWTDRTGRVEFQFADGGILRLDSRSKLDFLAHDGERAILRLWSGGLFLRTRESRSAESYEIETAAGVVVPTRRGNLRIDVDSGETRVSVELGEASLDNQKRRIRIDAGEVVYALPGEAPGDPQRADRLPADDFASWSEERDRRVSRNGASRRYLPDEVDTWADDFDDNGEWYYETEVGYVWRPVVSAGWRPYWDGRWIWTSYGWTWVPHEPWGWAPFHYGRWGHSPALGWYWIPGRSWGGAWVSWAIGGDYVGWCALGYRDRPVYAQERGRAVARGTLANANHGEAWFYARRGDLGARDIARRRLENDPNVAREVQVLDVARARPTRDLRVGGVDRETGPVRARPRVSVGDFVPEMRADRMTTIPAPMERRRKPRDEDRDKPQSSIRYEEETSRARESEAARGSGRGFERDDTARDSQRERREAEAARERQSEQQEAERSRGRSRESVRPRRDDGDAGRDLLQNFFRRVPREREERGGESRTDRGGSGGRPRDDGSASRERGGESAGRGEGRARARGGESGGDRGASQPAGDRAAPRPKREKKDN